MKTPDEIVESLRICADEKSDCKGCAYRKNQPCMRKLLIEASVTLTQKMTMLNIAEQENERLKKLMKEKEE